MLLEALSALPPDKISALLSSAKKPQPENKVVAFLWETASVFQSGHPEKPALPISIKHNLPHINLGIGQHLSKPNFTYLLHMAHAPSSMSGQLSFILLSPRDALY
jgi:hypothetical protein